MTRQRVGLDGRATVWRTVARASLMRCNFTELGEPFTRQIEVVRV
jgi:hypothetical protein